MNPCDELAVIIPVAPEEKEWAALLSDLVVLPNSTEIIMVGTTPTQVREPCNKGQNIKYIVSPKGRARQLNAGARATEKRFLWFLHADSRVEKEAIEAVAHSLTHSERPLYFCDLLFDVNEPPLTFLNSVGAWLRSHVLGLPFGDQGFCLSRTLFEKLGGFDETVPYGEDHLLVWRAHQNGIPVRSTSAVIRTSARRYRDHGWGRTTARNMILTGKQALPELFKLIRKRVANEKP